MRGAKCDAADCDTFERGGSAGALVINMESLPPTERRQLGIKLYDEDVLDLDEKEYLDMKNGKAMPRMGRVHVELCKGHLLTGLTQYGVLGVEEDVADSEDEDEEQA